MGGHNRFPLDIVDHKDAIVVLYGEVQPLKWNASLVPGSIDVGPEERRFADF